MLIQGFIGGKAIVVGAAAPCEGEEAAGGSNEREGVGGPAQSGENSASSSQDDAVTLPFYLQ
jgi:hypothetical protein